MILGYAVASKCRKLRRRTTCIPASLKRPISSLSLVTTAAAFSTASSTIASSPWDRVSTTWYFLAYARAALACLSLAFESSPRTEPGTYTGTSPKSLLSSRSRFSLNWNGMRRAFASRTTAFAKASSPHLTTPYPIRRHLPAMRLDMAIL